MVESRWLGSREVEDLVTVYTVLGVLLVLGVPFDGPVAKTLTVSFFGGDHLR